jgi:hypothetical protein
MATRSTQEIIEVSAQADDAEVRSTQEIIEVSAERNDNEVRATQEIIEVSAERDDNEVRATQVMMEVSVLYTDWSSEGVARNGRHENGAPENVTPAWGPQGAWDVENYGERHAKDIYDGSPLYHWLWSEIWAKILDNDGDGSTLDADLLDGQEGAYYLALANATGHLSLAKLAGYVRGYVIRGGAADWDAYDASGDKQVLIGDGTDLVSRVLANGDLPDPLAFNNAPTTLTLSGGAVAATQNLHIIAAETGTTDDLDTINGLTDRQLLIIKADTGDTITVKHATGNVHFDSGNDFELSGDSWLLLFYDGSNAVALGAGGSSTVDAADVTYTPVDNDDYGGADPGNVDDALDDLASRTETLETGRVDLLFTQTVTQEVVNTTTETNLLNAGRGSKTLTADLLQSGDALRLRLSGKLSDTGTPSPTISIELGGTTLASATPTLSGITDVDWHFNILITCRVSGASGKLLASGLFDYDEGSEISLESASEVSLDTTPALEMAINWTWDVADASNDIDCRQAILEHLKVTNLAPVAPTGLTATAVTSTVQLTWADNSDNESGFSIERSTTSATAGFAEIATIGAGVTSHDDSGLAAGTYWYRLRSYDASGRYSDYSNVAEVTVTE